MKQAISPVLSAAALAAVALMVPGSAFAGSEAAIDTAAVRGGELWAERCAACHDNPRDRIPPRFAISKKTSDQVVRALTTGTMRQQAEGLGQDDIHTLAVFLTYKNAGTWPEPDPKANLCQQPATTALAARPARGAEWRDWGGDAENTRYAADPGFTAAEVPRLKLKWAFGYPGSEAVGLPTRAGNLLLVPSVGGLIFALDAESGCTYWTHDAGAPVKSALAIGAPAKDAAKGTAPAAFFGDMGGHVHAIDLATGRPLWKAKAHPHALAQVRGSVKLHEGILYAPVSSGEESAAVDPAYPCCTFRGALVAFDAATGRIVWTAHTLKEEPKPLGKNTAGTPIFGPSGGGTWSAPTIDAKRGRIYIGTGNGYSGEDPGTLDAMMAIDLKTGTKLWATQTTPDDIYVVCVPGGQGSGNCPEKIGPDVDFAASAILRTLPGGGQMVMAGQKSGMVYGFDPDTGKKMWQTKVGEGGAYGGIEHGIAASPDLLFVPLSDIKPSVAVPMEQTKPRPEGGLFAIEPATGKIRWHTPAPKPNCAWGEVSCSVAQPAAASAMPGIVFSGALDGHLRAYDATDGKVVWDFDTGRAFDAVNGGQAHGGAVNGYGPILSGGMLYVNSGGGYYGPAGNALLAFSVDGK